MIMQWPWRLCIIHGSKPAVKCILSLLTGYIPRFFSSPSDSNWESLANWTRYAGICLSPSPASFLNYQHLVIGDRCNMLMASVWMRWPGYCGSTRLIGIGWQQQVQMSFRLSSSVHARTASSPEASQEMLTWVSNLAVFPNRSSLMPALKRILGPTVAFIPSRMVFLNIWGCLHKLFNSCVSTKMHFYGKSSKCTRSVFMKLFLLNKKFHWATFTALSTFWNGLGLHRVKLYHLAWDDFSQWMSCILKTCMLI